mmetsp:Transcript_20085/g.30854  ORF Transcript_20085/g.30854 Transcript_20085/m.30854 type:complete len:96 (+) Transcript_20085:107-394(+)
MPTISDSSSLDLPSERDLEHQELFDRLYSKNGSKLQEYCEWMYMFQRGEIIRTPTTKDGLNVEKKSWFGLYASMRQYKPYFEAPSVLPIRPKNPN